MKLIKTKVLFLFSTFCMLLCTTVSAQLVVSKPSDASIRSLQENADARTLSAYLTSQGYKKVGLIDEGVAEFSQTEDATAPVTTLVVERYSKAGVEDVELSISSDNLDGRTEYKVQAENTRSTFNVVGGGVTTAAKISINWQKILECYNKYLKGNAQNCVSCYNCLKACISAGGSNWKKLKCCLSCSSCWKCLSSIWKFFWCVF